MKKWFPIEERKFRGHFCSNDAMVHDLALQGYIARLDNSNYIEPAFMLVVKTKNGKEQQYVMGGAHLRVMYGCFILEGFSHTHPDNLILDPGPFHRTEWRGPVEALR